MIPLRAQMRGTHRAIVSWVFMLVCIGVLVRLATLPPPVATDIMFQLAVVPARLLAAPLTSGQAFTLVTSCFLHAGWIHLASNMLFLGVFGPPVESRLGWRLFTGLFIASGAIGALAFALQEPHSATPLVGASGAIAGVLGAHLILEPRARITTLIPAFVTLEIASLPAAFVILVWFATQVAANLAPVTQQAGAGVAWTAHIAGFAAGVLLAAPARMVGRQRKSGRRRYHSAR